MEPGRGRTHSDAPARLLAATRELLDEMRPGDITVRTIAERAHLQHSLITRYFGSRNALVAMALGAILAERAEVVAAAPDLDAAVGAMITTFVENPTLSSSLGVLVADGVVPDLDRYPIVEVLETRLRAEGIPATTARETALVVVVTISGWASAEPWWLRVSGLGDLAAGRAVLERAVAAIIADARR